MSGSAGRSSSKQHGKKVHPQIVLEKSIAENVSNFIYEVLPSQNAQTYEDKEQVLWVKFEQCDVNDVCKYKNSVCWEGGVEPLLLIIGYAHGVQGWIIPSGGVAEEVFSWRQGVIKALKVLPTPVTSSKVVDKFSLKRPLIAFTEEPSSSQVLYHVSFFSLKVNDQVDLINFQTPVQNIEANKNIVVIIFADKISVFDAGTLENMFNVSKCYPNPDGNAIALGDRWIAYPDSKLHIGWKSWGGCVGEPGTYKSSVLDMMKNVKSAWSDFSYGKDKNSRRPKTPPSQPGIVTIVATQLVEENEVNLDTGHFQGVLAHFTAHSNKIAHMKFNPSGLLLATADCTGRSFNIFSIQVDPKNVKATIVYHQYVLHRGDTEATILDMCFSLDSRWIAVSSQRGTTHVYPINPYGGNVCWRTHKTPYVLNKLTGFERTTGSHTVCATGRESPRSIAPGISYDYNHMRQPLPPVTLTPHAQLKQCLRTVLESLGTATYVSTFGGKSPANVPDESIKIATLFGTMRGASTAEVCRKNRHTVCLYVAACHGNLTEYVLEPKVDPKFPKGKDDIEAPIELNVQASYQWALLRAKSHPDLLTPLPSDSPLLKSMSNRRDTISPARSIDDDPEDSWIAQVEIHTHIGPHRRIWMGPQFRFVDQSEHRSEVKSLGRSSPMDVPIGTTRRQVIIEAHSYSGHTELSPFNNDSPRFVDSNEHEAALSRIKSQLAEAIQDETGLQSHIINPSYDEPFDASDLMDISCQPPGPNISGKPIPTTPRPIKYEDQFQSITPKLASVVIARSSPACPELQPFWGKRTPSLEECRGLTSSAEELCTALRDSHIHENSSRLSPWKPIEQPSSTEASHVQKPLAVSASIDMNDKFDNIPLSKTTGWVEDYKPFESSQSSSAVSELPVDNKCKKPTKSERKKVVVGSGTTSEDDWAPVRHTSKKGSGTTSEDDWAPVRDTSKKDRKKKKKKSVQSYEEPTKITESKSNNVDDENGNQDAMYEDNDLEKALEEASSDPEITVTVKRKSHTEMFPFVDSSSEDNQTSWRRDDDETTSGDDRKATSESDASPVVSINSKKSKKRKKNK